MTDARSHLLETADVFRRSWKSLALADLLYKAIATVALAPLVGVLFRVVVAMSGDTVLADQDILFFFLGPLGWLCLVAIGSLWLGIMALEQSALLVILATADQQPIGVTGALRFALANTWSVVRVTARLIVYTLLTIAPLLAIAGVTYLSLLTEFDINYYLQERPPVFYAALAVGGVVVVAVVAVVLRLTSGWFFALPLVIFENVVPALALKTSRERADGHRRTLLLWIVGWGVATIVVSSLASGVVVGVGRLIVPHATGSLPLLSVAIGVTVMFWAAVSLAVNLISSTSFAVVLFKLYGRLGSAGSIDVEALGVVAAEASFRGPRITRGRLLSAAVITVVIALGVGVYTIGGVRLEDDVTITAHRGSSDAAPENTMAAVRQAIADGTDWVEIDVQETADGEIVVFHDSDFMKLAGVDLKIWDATMADLEQIDIGSWFGEEFKDQRVPTLDAVLDECQGKAGVNIELKYYGHDKQLEQRVVDIVEAHNMASEVVLMSLKLDAVRKIKSLRPDWQVGLLMSVAVGGVKQIEADFLAVNAAFVDRRFVRRAHDAGKQVYVWTVNDAAGISVMMGRGVDSVITDKPALARTVLEERAKMGPAERLLMELAGVLGVPHEIGEQ